MLPMQPILMTLPLLQLSTRPIRVPSEYDVTVCAPLRASQAGQWQCSGCQRVAPGDGTVMP
jgi:hypothetical protein